MAIVSFTDEDGVHFTDEFSKSYEKYLKAKAEKGAATPEPVAKPDVKSDPKGK
ncbi:hypothetical protein [Rhodococcus erythropolis]|uniref:hypothetical protein n=1 Tax=Rhodococcus erythropolis TaxID=1833 RepID=UPI00366BF976